MITVVAKFCNVRYYIELQSIYMRRINLGDIVRSGNDTGEVCLYNRVRSNQKWRVPSHVTVEEVAHKHERRDLDRL